MIDTLIEFLKDVFLVKIPETLLNIVDYVIDALGYILSKILNFIMDLVTPIIDTLGIGDFNIIGDMWSNLPTGLVQFATAINFPEALTILISALAIRFIKSLIPFIG